jgi:DNA polymerase elongation subunit (family B)
MKGLLTYFRNSRIMYKNLAAEYKTIDKKKSTSFDRKQLPIKIFINAFFGSLSAPQVFPWGDIDMGEQITCTGRQYLRQMLKFFSKKRI